MKRVMLCMVIGAVAVACLWQRGAVAQGEPALIMLLRFMAVLKALCAVGAFALTWWRLRQPGSKAMAYGYAVAVALMAASPVLIWDIRDVVAGALVFHAGLLFFAGLAWADGRTWKSLPARRRQLTPNIPSLQGTRHAG